MTDTRLLPVQSSADILPVYRDTPIGLLLEYHNLEKSFSNYAQAQLLIGMCMDNRKHLHIPDNFAFILRTGGANLQYAEFRVSYAIGVGGVKHIALIGHNNCGMSNLTARRQIFIDGLVTNAGWTAEHAADYFDRRYSEFEIGNEVDFILSESKRIRALFPKIIVAPMLYLVEDGRLYLIKES